MKTIVTLIRAGVPTTNGMLFPATVLKKMAEEDPERLFIDEEGNLCSKYSDTETEEFERALRGTPQAELLGSEALDNFQAILKHREAKGAKTSRRPAWIPVEIEEKD